MQCTLVLTAQASLYHLPQVDFLKRGSQKLRVETDKTDLIARLGLPFRKNSDGPSPQHISPGRGSGPEETLRTDSRGRMETKVLQRLCLLAKCHGKSVFHCCQLSPMPNTPNSFPAVHHLPPPKVNCPKLRKSGDQAAKWPSIYATDIAQWIEGVAVFTFFANPGMEGWRSYGKGQRGGRQGGT